MAGKLETALKVRKISSYKNITKYFKKFTTANLSAEEKDDEIRSLKSENGRLNSKIEDASQENRQFEIEIRKLKSESERLNRQLEVNF